MKPKSAFYSVGFFLLIVSTSLAGTWSDHFAGTALLPDWTGTRDAFSIASNQLVGRSISPLAPAPFNYVEVAKDSSDSTVSAWINVISPNLAVCTKGAILARHTGDKGYVFALHAATQTAEIYRYSTNETVFGTGEMLLKVPWKIDYKHWYFARVELHGPTMSFYIDGNLVGTINDSVSLNGSVGLVAQDTQETLYDDFTVTGPNVVGNVDGVLKPQVATVQTTSTNVVFSFTAEPPYDYFVEVNSVAAPTPDWQTIATFRAKTDAFVATVTDANTNELRFYRIEKVPCDCR